jgi:hypothetical protein
VQTEVLQLQPLDLPLLQEARGDPGDQYLLPVARGRDPRGEVYGRAEVVLVAHHGRASVHPYADANLPDLGRPFVHRQLALGLDRALEGVRRAVEGHHERVALGLDHHTVPGGNGLAHDGVMLPQHRLKGVPQAVP